MAEYYMKGMTVPIPFEEGPVVIRRGYDCGSTGADGIFGKRRSFAGAQDDMLILLNILPEKTQLRIIRKILMNG